MAIVVLRHSVVSSAEEHLETSAAALEQLETFVAEPEVLGVASQSFSPMASDSETSVPGLSLTAEFVFGSISSVSGF